MKRRWPQFRNVSNYLTYPKRIRRSLSIRKRPGQAKVPSNFQKLGLDTDQPRMKFSENLPSKSKVVRRLELSVELVQVKVPSLLLLQELLNSVEAKLKLMVLTLEK